MTDRHTADTINSDALDQLYERLDRARAAAALHRQGLLTTAELYAVIEAAHESGPAATQATDSEQPLFLPRAEVTTLHRTLGQLLGDEDAQAIARVRALHHEEYGSCAECTHEFSVPFPCPTVRAIDGEEQP
jgi:uncharacterized protein with gpF-like domain